MKILTDKRCIIGEGPIWSEKEQKLYFTNGFGNEICTYDFTTDKVSVRALPFGISSFAFDINNRLIISHEGGVHILNDSGSISQIYDHTKFEIKHANDMKVGPDGAIYVGTQSEKRKGISDKIDGKLYRISSDGSVRVLLDGLLLSNGMEWSIDETKFYHTDSDTQIIKEYSFDKASGAITYSGRQIAVLGVDGFTIGKDGRLYVGCWGGGHIAVVDTSSLEICDYIDIPTQIPTSCSFCGENMDILAITTASFGADIKDDKNAGFTIVKKSKTVGRLPYLFGEIK
ncbi:MAG: SMP-30/gluconolactonase/LRE family protein [Clostridia bacterium]|nr:SMP-30/gluconolactonase/LRE family protein [Clostridia bacterium]